MVWWLVSALGIWALEKYFFKGQNAIWGGATGGVIVGLVIAIVRPGFEWSTVGKSAVIGAFLGLMAEALGAIGDRMRRKG